MRIPGIKTAKAISRWVQARILGGALILGYHRVSRISDDRYEVSVSPENFAEHLEVLRKHAHLTSLSSLAKQLKADTLLPKTVAVTFDDGYADTLYEAKPLLEKYEVPATVFVCTGNFGGEFWWDELNRLIVSSSRDLQALLPKMEERGFSWRQPARSPDAVHVNPMTDRKQLQHDLYHFLLDFSHEDQMQIMEIVRDWSGLPAEDRLAYRSMNQSEMLQLADGGLVELGSHTRNHPMLPRISLESQRNEILSGKQDLENLLGHPVDGFSYPNGRATEDAKRIVCGAGFAYACTSLHNVVRPGSDPYEYTRFWQKDVDGDTFLQGLKHWI